MIKKESFNMVILIKRMEKSVASSGGKQAKELVVEKTINRIKTQYYRKVVFLLGTPFCLASYLLPVFYRENDAEN